jgi:serine/threonine protein kinase
LGPYEILAPIGAGGMGEVYKAIDTKLDREVAIKVLPNDLARDPERLARFEREAKVLASLNHPNIATIYAIEESPEGIAIAMELVLGHTLQGPLPLDTALNYARQIAEALEAAHEKGITHRDLKPPNIMIAPDDVVKVLDFGLASLPGHETDSTTSNSPTLTMAATQTGMVMGTAAYMSPEQAAGKPVDRRADIWSFGVVLWEMITGAKLFEGETISHTLADVLRAPIDFAKLPAATPPPVVELLKRCLDRDPRRRLRDIGEARIAIEKYLADPASAAAPLRTELRVPSKWALTLAALLGAAALALGFVSYRHLTEEPPRITKASLLPPQKGEFRQNSIPAVSPDGRWIAFVAASQGKVLLWVRGLDSLAARALPGTEGAFLPFWSPDSRTIAFFADGKLKKIEIAGGQALTLCDVAGAFGGSWSRNDVIVFNNGSNIVRVPAAGGSVTPVTTLDWASGEITHRYPWFLPDGRHFLYTIVNQNSAKTAVYAADLASAEHKLIAPAPSNAAYALPGYLLFVRERTLLAQPFDTGKLQTTGDAIPIAEQVDAANGFERNHFSISQNGVLAYVSGGPGSGALQLTWYDRTGKALAGVGKPAYINTPRLSPDGKTVATDRLDPASNNRDIWLLDVARGSEQRLTFADQNWFPVWSPDGRRVVYLRLSSQKVLSKSADGTGPEEEVEAAAKAPQDWTRDGRYLISATQFANPKTGNDLWALPFVPGKSVAAGKPLPLRNSEFQEYHGRVSPDGRWLAYQSNESKRTEVYVVAFPGLNGHWQVSVNGGSRPVWSRDGRELYFLDPDNKLMAVPVRSGEQFQAGAPQPLFDVRLSGNANASYDVSADGRFLFATPTEQAATLPMTVVVNWPAMLKK